MMLFVKEKKASVDSEDWKVEMLRLFPAILQLEESCVECGRQTDRGAGGRGGGSLTFFLQHNNLY